METLQALTVVDYIIIAILVLALAIGWARGIVELLTGFVSFLVATVVAGRYAPTGVDWVNRTWGAQDRLAGVLERRINLPAEAHEIPLSAIPWHKALELLEDVPLPETYKQELAQQVVEWSEAAGNQTAASFIFQELASVVLWVAVFVGLVLVIGWILAVLGHLISDQIKEIPIVGTTNRLLGGAALVLQAVVLLALLIGAFVPVLAMYGAKGLDSAVGAAQLTPYFLTVFEWIRTWLFGTAGGQLFSA